MARGLIVAAPRSGSGKTSVVLALLAAFAKRGITVRGAKAGPDYIDPAFHAALTGHPSFNLDSWAMPEAMIRSLAARSGSGADLVLIESAMGLFDGIPGQAGRSGAAADLAALLDLPVLLVLDISGQSQTAAAVARGIANHDPRVKIAGIVLNRVGSERHRRLVAQAMAEQALPVVGTLLRDVTLALPERHLGLVQAGEHADLAERFARLGEAAERSFALDAIAMLAAPLRAEPALGDAGVPRPPGQRIALARDAAFSFIYPHLTEAWRRAGAEIVPFSPLNDEPPPAECDACWLPGGYPELHAGRLAAASRFQSGMAAFARAHPVHGECGGYMVLGEGLEDAAGERHRMLGLLDHATSFQQRRLHLGYREARLLGQSALGAAGTVIRGHEFHYSSLIAGGRDAPLADLFDGEGQPLGPTGGQRGQVSGSFFHAIAVAA